MLRSLAFACSLAFLAGCGGGPARIKGRVLDNGQPLEVAAQASLVLVPSTPDGKPDNKSYVMSLNPDGSFELVAYGGSLPPGKYFVTLEVNAQKSTTGIAKFKGQYSQVPIELKDGLNDLTLDLSNPNR